MNIEKSMIEKAAKAGLRSVFVGFEKGKGSLQLGF